MLATTGRNTPRGSRWDSKATTDASGERDRLLRVLQELEVQTLNRARPLCLDQNSEPLPDGDSWNKSVERDLEAVLAERAYETLRRIDEARARVEEGTYGLCRRCGGSIPNARLRVLPFAVLCRSCQAREERDAPPPRARL